MDKRKSLREADPEGNSLPKRMREVITSANPVSREEWLRALESGKHHQHTGALADWRWSETCCIGVAPVLRDVHHVEMMTRSPDSVGCTLATEDAAWMIHEFTGEDQELAVALNDGSSGVLLHPDRVAGALNPYKGQNFAGIAAFFRLRWNMPRVETSS